jgi:hypothetical protein
VFGEEYAMEVARGADRTRTLSGPFDGQDGVLEFETGRSVGRTHVVDGDGHVVTGGRCVVYPDVAAGLASASRVRAFRRGVSNDDTAISGLGPVNNLGVKPRGIRLDRL